MPRNRFGHLNGLAGLSGNGMIDKQTIVALGDSLTEGFGVAPGDAYPVKLAEWLRQQGIACRMINAGISGDTCRGVLSRLEPVRMVAPDLVILEIGVNDVLMGAMTDRIQANVGAIVENLRSAGITVALAGMELPPMGDPETEDAFAALYPAVAEAYGLPFIPGFTAPLWAQPGRLQYDGLHPNAAGYAAIVRHIAPWVKAALKR